jgi:hypothetical protein
MGEKYSKLINGLIFHTSDTGGLIFDTKKKADKVKYLVKNICEKDYDHNSRKPTTLVMG